VCFILPAEIYHGSSFPAKMPKHEKKQDTTQYLVTQDRQDKFSDDVYMTMANQIEEIRSSISMYVSPLGTQGGLHLCKEIINNAIDEAMNAESKINTRKIYVTFNEGTRQFTITDEGRGIPLDFLKDTVCKKHMGTKTIGKANRNKDLAGMNGVGLTVIAALSDYMSITSYRGFKAKTLEFHDGVLSEGKVQTLKKERYGLSVSSIPSEKYLGPMDLTRDIVEDYFRHMSYILRGDISIYYEGSLGDDKHKILYKRSGLKTNVEYLSSSLEFAPVEVECENEDFGLEVAFSYDRSLDEMICDSYANYIITTEGGTHEQVAQRAICEFLSREAKKLDPTNKIEISYDDCRKGLVMAVNCRHVKPILEGQHKSKLSSQDVLKSGRYMIQKVLTAYFHENPGLLRKIIGYLRNVAKARLESNKIKGVSTSHKPMSLLQDAEIKGFFNISDRYWKGYKELYICEGDSAAGALENCRNKKYQALYGVMGVTDNIYDMSLSQLMNAPTFRNLVTILGCGIGKDFDLNKLRYNKIIICADSDSDGRYITSLIMCFFLIFMPEVIEAGRLFKAMPPLYLLKKDGKFKYYKGREFLYDKRELYQIENTAIANNVEFALDGDNKNIKRGLTKKEAIDWLNMNAEYMLELNNLAARSSCGPTVVEYAAYFKLVCGKDEQRFKMMIERQFPEMTYDIQTQSLSGSWDLKEFSLICDKLFMRSAERYMALLVKNPSLFVYVKNKNDDSDYYDKMTIGQFLGSMGAQYSLGIEQRFKGLGEADAYLLFMTTMNPKTRKLLRITMPDKKKAEEVFQLLHQKSEKMIEARRDLLDNTTISYADIDN